YTYCMLTYSTLQDRPREFLAATGLTHDEFARVLPAFAAAYAVLYPPDKTWEGKVRHRQSGGGAKGVLFQMEDQLLFIRVSQQQKEPYSGKKKTPTDKHLVLVNEHTTQGVYLGPTIAGRTHDKKAADAAQICSPTNATLGKDTGFQGYEPAGGLTRQPKKNRKARS